MQNGYAAGKAWIRSLALALAREYRRAGVGIFAFNPRLVWTEMVLRPSVVAGYEGSLQRVYSAILSMWANPPQVAARKVVWLASPAIDGRTGLEINLPGEGLLLLGALRMALRRLVGRATPAHIEIRCVPPADVGASRLGGRPA